MASTTLHRTVAVLASAALLASLTIASVAAPATAAKPRCDGKVATIVGTDKSETIRGTKKADVIVAKGGKDIVYGRGGKDLVCGGDGGDVLKGGDGADILKGGAGSDTLNGGAGTDGCTGGAGFDRLFSCDEPATTGTLSITADTTLTAPHKGEVAIDADNVTLDCDGHTISGPGSGTGIMVNTRQGVTVINCHPTSFYAGIVVLDSSGISIRRSSANRNNEGIRVQGSIADLTANVANRNATWGIHLTNAAGTTLTGNRADHNAKHGFALNTDGTWLESNIARWNRQSNIDLYRSQGNTLRHNVTKGRSIGFHLGESSDNLLKGNTARDHGSGFHTFDSTDNTFRGNTARGNGEGFSDNSRGGSGTKGTDNTYVNNTCIGNDLRSHPAGLC